MPILLDLIRNSFKQKLLPKITFQQIVSELNLPSNSGSAASTIYFIHSIPITPTLIRLFRFQVRRQGLHWIRFETGHRTGMGLCRKLYYGRLHRTRRQHNSKSRHVQTFIPNGHTRCPARRQHWQTARGTPNQNQSIQVHY